MSSIRDKLRFEKLITVDDTGLPKAPSIKQLQDKDVRRLYERDNTPDKSMYMKECGVIYYLGDPKSAPKQKGLSNSECIKMAIENYSLPKNYVPDVLVLKIARKYYEDNITEAGVTVENLLKGIHNINLVSTKLNELLNQKIQSCNDVTAIGEITNIMKQLKDQMVDIPLLTKKLDEAYQALLYETQTNTSRGGVSVSSSMDAEEAED